MSVHYSVYEKTFTKKTHNTSKSKSIFTWRQYMLLFCSFFSDIVFFDNDPPRTDSDKLERRDNTLEQLMKFVPGNILLLIPSFILNYHNYIKHSVMSTFNRANYIWISLIRISIIPSNSTSLPMFLRNPYKLFVLNGIRIIWKPKCLYQVVFAFNSR